MDFVLIITGLREDVDKVVNKGKEKQKTQFIDREKSTLLFYIKKRKQFETTRLGECTFGSSCLSYNFFLRSQ